VQRPPQRHPHRGLICLGNRLLISHGDNLQPEDQNRLSRTVRALRPSGRGPAIIS
jgi:hypothetical protein